MAEAPAGEMVIHGSTGSTKEKEKEAKRKRKGYYYHPSTQTAKVGHSQLAKWAIPG